MTYLPEWAREDSPTKTMTTDAMLKYYKDHSVAGWCRFYLENPGDTSPALLADIQALADSCRLKQKPAHRAQRDVLARRWQTEAADRAYADVTPRPMFIPKEQTGPTCERALAALQAAAEARADAQRRLADACGQEVAA